MLAGTLKGIDRWRMQTYADELIDIPDEQPPPELVDELPSSSDSTIPADIAPLLAIRSHDQSLLTDEEYDLLMQWERSQRLGYDDPHDHNANLAEFLDSSTLASIGADIQQWVKWDEESRSEWYEMEKRGIRALGVSPNTDGGADFDGASDVVHPVLAEACVHFQARALETMWPAGGPAKSAVIGKVTPERMEQSNRVAGFLNYQYTTAMRGGFDTTDLMMLRLPVSGSVFTKCYWDPLEGGIARKMVQPASFVVPYRATDLETSSRYTEIIYMKPNNLRKMQVLGVYRDVTVPEPNWYSYDSDRQIVEEEITATEGRQDLFGAPDVADYTLYECYCDLDISGFEHRDERGKPTGIQLPYVVTMDRDSQQVLSIYRNWKQSDPFYRRRILHTHYRFLPGLGFYGYGFYHWIGGLARAATGSLRALLDSAMFANMQGGVRSKQAGIRSEELKIGPGEWPEVDADADDIRKAFFPLPYHEPSAVLFNLLGGMEELARRFAGTTDVLVGQGTQNTPVGTTLARIEQGMKVNTAIQKRMYEAQARELKIVHDLNFEYLPDEYPYEVEKEERSVFKADFDSRIDVQPVADPNFVSNSQRMFINQMIMDMAATAPGLYDQYQLHRRALIALKVQDVDELLPDTRKVATRCNPVTENVKMMTGQPVKAFMEQNHGAHVAVHLQMMNSLDPMVAKQVGPLVMSHIQEHMAMGYLVDMQRMTGVDFQESIEKSEDGEEVERIPVELENRMALAAANAVQQMTPPQPDPVAMEEERKSAVVKADIARRDQESQAEISRKDRMTQAEIDRKDAQAVAEQVRRGDAERFDREAQERAEAEDKGE